MGKRKTTSEIKANTIKGNRNRVTINNHPAPAPPINKVPDYVLHQNTQNELAEAKDRIRFLQSHVERLTEEVKRLRGHISEKDDYINAVLFRRA